MNTAMYWYSVVRKDTACGQGHGKLSGGMQQQRLPDCQGAAAAGTADPWNAPWRTPSGGGRACADVAPGQGLPPLHKARAELA